MLGAGILITGLGLTLIPYVPSQSPWLPMILVVILIALGNGLFQPSYSSILAGLARSQNHDLGLVMGAQESLGAFARILGPLTGGLVWDATFRSEGLLSKSTVFHLCGLMMIIAFSLYLLVNTKDDLESE